MRVKDIMTTNISFVYENATIYEIAKLMEISNVGIVPICDKFGKPLGIVTDRDIVIKTVAKNNLDICAKEIMSPCNVFTTSDCNIHDAALLMSSAKLKRLPVIDESSLVGILSLSDLAKRKMLLCEVGDIYNALVKP